MNARWKLLFIKMKREGGGETGVNRINRFAFA